MPTRDSSTNPDDGMASKERDRDRERDSDRADRADRGGSRQKSSAAAASASKSLYSHGQPDLFFSLTIFIVAKDLSHVPCKFYKVGGCTAGTSCPFSHVLLEPGGQKETCAWFVKGNCKFGHKCALAHILPGQSMAMDRKNKKAAQLAASAANSDRNERSERGRDAKGGRGGGNAKRDGHGPGTVASGPGVAANRNPLLAGGSTAPTRAPTSPNPTGRPPMTMPLKATLSPSAPAPPLASFGLPDDLDGAEVELATAPAKQSSQDGTLSNSTSDQTSTPEYDQPQKGTSSPGPLPTSAPRPTTTSAREQPDFGPIGSPPTSSSYKMNGTTAFSPGTSPRAVNGIDVVAGTPPNSTTNRNSSLNFLSTSPFSAPGRQYGWSSGGSYNGGGGITASLGSGIAMMGGRAGWSGGGEGGSVGTGGLGGTLSQRRAPGGEYDVGLEYEEFAARGKGKRTGLGVGRSLGQFGADIAVEDEDLEDFLPSSLTDLLTPEERSRRMSRSNSGQGPGASLSAGFGSGELGTGMGTGTGASAGTGGGSGLGHRYSRSVPAPSLLGDFKSIWADTNVPPLPSPTHRGTPSSSFAARFDPGAGAGHTRDDSGVSMSIGSTGGIASLSPSNASAAFLPGLHQHYLSSKAKQAQQHLGLGVGKAGGVRGTSGPLFTSTTGTNDSTIASNYLLGSNALSTNARHTPQPQPQHSYRATPSPFDLTQQQQQYNLHPQPPHTTRPIPSTGGSGANSPSINPDDPHHSTHLLSPSTRALQAHAPGQSLPQGLAAGYSRIHALPPPPSLASPGSASIFGGGTPPAADVHVPSSGPYGGWKSAGSPPPTIGGAGAGAGLDAMFSRLSYSAAAASASARGPPGNHVPAIGNNGNEVGIGIGNGHASGNGGNTNMNMNMSPPGLQRNASGGRYQQHPLSPLSGPVVTRDDDDELFSMDG